MRLVTYDLDGSRRLGAQVDGVVLDLPDVVGHPAFPRTLEALVARPRGTAMDAARSALAQPAYLHDCDVPGARLLAPLLIEGQEVVGPDAELAWPGPADRLDCEPAVACVVGAAGTDLSAAEAAEAIFGYTVVNTWWAAGRPGSSPGGVAAEPRDPQRARRAGTRIGPPPGGPAPGRTPFTISMGPCVVTPDQVDLRRSRLVARVDGEVWLEADLRATAAVFARTVARASARGGVRPGDLFGAPADGGAGRGGAFGSRSGRHGPRGRHRPAPPEVVVEIEVAGIGTLRTRVSATARVGPLVPSSTARRGFTTPR
jgi:Fumarylacetoacetate (FAA) hydrolase family